MKSFANPLWNMDDRLLLSLFLTAGNKWFLITHWFTMLSALHRTQQILAVLSRTILPLGVFTGVKHRKNVLPLWKYPAGFTEASSFF